VTSASEPPGDPEGPPVITGIAVERVELRCPDSHWQSVVDYDLVPYVEADGDTWSSSR